MSPMLCQSCSQNPATIHFTEIKNEEKRELHVCESCANAQGLTGGPPIPAMLANLVQGVRRSNAKSPKCPDCGITFDDFRAKGRFGCPKDYEVFEELLGPLLEKIHGSKRHVGRLPRGRTEATAAVGDRLLRLRRDLQSAVKAEQYEKAAGIRDEILKAEEAQRNPTARKASGTA